MLGHGVVTGGCAVCLLPAACCVLASRSMLCACFPQHAVCLLPAACCVLASRRVEEIAQHAGGERGGGASQQTPHLQHQPPIARPRQTTYMHVGPRRKPHGPDI
eukprot:jgi/Ulvmu1/12610/UM093_0002.1